MFNGTIHYCYGDFPVRYVSHYQVEGTEILTKKTLRNGSFSQLQLLLLEPTMGDPWTALMWIC